MSSEDQTHGDTDDEIVLNPDTDAYTLSIIAGRRPELWKAIYFHPNTDPSWLVKIKEEFDKRGEKLPDPEMRLGAPGQDEATSQAAQEELTDWVEDPDRKRGPSIFGRLFKRG